MARRSAFGVPGLSRLSDGRFRFDLRHGDPPVRYTRTYPKGTPLTAAKADAQRRYTAILGGAERPRDRAKRARPAGSCVYFIEDRGLVKIGFTSNPSLRWRNYRTENLSCRPLLIWAHKDAAVLETEIHADLAHVRIPDTEWFLFTSEVRDLIYKIAKLASFDLPRMPRPIDNA